MGRLRGAIITRVGGSCTVDGGGGTRVECECWVAYYIRQRGEETGDGAGRRVGVRVEVAASRAGVSGCVYGTQRGIH